MYLICKSERQRRRLQFTSVWSARVYISINKNRLSAQGQRNENEETQYDIALEHLKSQFAKIYKYFFFILKKEK